MVSSGNKEIVSCFQCQGIYFCYGSKDPAIDREQARAIALKCSSYHKGFPVERVRVYGYDRGLSRKNAEKLVMKGIARWIGYKMIELIDRPPRNIYKRLVDNNKNNEK